MERKNKIIAFAAEEWEKYFYLVTRSHNVWPVEIQFDDTMDRRLDEFVIKAHNEKLHITASSARAALYGVYEACKSILNVTFVRPDYEVIPHCEPADLKNVVIRKKADIPMRAYTVDRPSDYLAPIDVLVKLGYNTYSISARCWEQEKARLKPEMEKRGIELVISGHDLGFFVPPDKYFDEHPDWFSYYQGKRIPTQMCYSSQEFAQELGKNLLAYIDKEKISQITLMFNDNSFKCTCEKCRNTGFMISYLNLLAMVQQYLKDNGSSVSVFHLAYNAALAWDMLEDVPESADSNCMIACWGRDYRDALSERKHNVSARFRDITERWSRNVSVHGRKLAFFEYYGDHWMMGTLLPPFGSLICRDIAYMKSIGTDRIDFLHFGFSGSLDTYREILEECNEPIYMHNEHTTEPYIFWYNMFIAGELMWDSSADFELLLERYTKACFKENGKAAAEFYRTAEAALVGLTHFAADMFKLRLTDPWYRDDFSDKATGKTNIRAWQPKQNNSGITEIAKSACREATKVLQSTLLLLESAETHDTDENYMGLVNCNRYLYNKLASLEQQYTAQMALDNDDYETASTCLETAIAFAKAYDGTELENCQEWLSRCRP